MSDTLNSGNLQSVLFSGVVGDRRATFYSSYRADSLMLQAFTVSLHTMQGENQFRISIVRLDFGRNQCLDPSSR